MALSAELAKSFTQTTPLEEWVILRNARDWGGGPACRQLQDLAEGFVRLTTVAGQYFGQLVSQLFGSQVLLPSPNPASFQWEFLALKSMFHPVVWEFESDVCRQNRQC